MEEMRKLRQKIWIDECGGGCSPSRSRSRSGSRSSSCSGYHSTHRRSRSRHKRHAGRSRSHHSNRSDMKKYRKNYKAQDDTSHHHSIAEVMNTSAGECSDVTTTQAIQPQIHSKNTNENSANFE